MEHLRELRIGGNQLNDRIDLTGFPNLQVLDISDVGLTSLTVARSLPASLKVLNCAKNKVADLCEVGHLKVLTTLEDLDMAQNPCLDDLDDTLAMIAIKGLAFSHYLYKVNGKKVEKDTVLKGE